MTRGARAPLVVHESRGPNSACTNTKKKASRNARGAFLYSATWGRVGRSRAVAGACRLHMTRLAHPREARWLRRPEVVGACEGRVKRRSARCADTLELLAGALAATRRLRSAASRSKNEFVTRRRATTQVFGSRAVWVKATRFRLFLPGRCARWAMGSRRGRCGIFPEWRWYPPTHKDTEVRPDSATDAEGRKSTACRYG